MGVEPIPDWDWRGSLALINCIRRPGMLENVGPYVALVQQASLGGQNVIVAIRMADRWSLSTGNLSGCGHP